ncbi:hypothetical protein PRZ48_009790 [Zasmidium cellare]|uniref:Peptidase M12A domain-containing protein n=1 Tax=Zasmidium cellare TaxID=395010 RepID=A0ABR0ECQ7_ZASCE|nr:hypothetical protein PRZ48_009790 [Zasmidium cellare]
MALPKVVGITLTTLTIPCFTAPIPTPSPSESLTRRGYTVDPTPDDHYSGDGVYAWPGQGKDQDGKNKNPIYYCWVTAEAADKYSDILEDAIKKWEAALYPNSALRIELYPDTHGNPHVVCKDLPQPVDALCLTDGGEEGSSVSTTGYNWIDQGQSYRHYVYMVGYGGKSHDEAVLDLAHELGHVMGLGHEHQRDDRDDNIIFECRYLSGVDEAYKAIKDSNDPAFADLGDDEEAKLDRTCDSWDLADKYFKNAKPFVLGRNVGYPFGQFKQNGNFDYNSIMIYSTWDNSVDVPDDKDNLDTAEILRYDQNGNPVRIFQGGNEDPALAGPTTGDVAAVVGLYPK